MGQLSATSITGGIAAHVIGRELAALHFEHVAQGEDMAELAQGEDVGTT